MEVDGVLFVLGLRVNLLSMSTLRDAGYATLFKSGYVLIYREISDPIEPLFMVIELIGCTLCEDNLQLEIQGWMRRKRLLRLQWAQGFSFAFRGKRGSLF